MKCDAIIANATASSKARVEGTPGSAASLRSRSEASHNLANLDLLRSVAVGLVFIGHLTATAKMRGLGDLGHFGVLLFFVHTAFVLMSSMERFGLSGSKLYGTFLIWRIFRIYPLSVLAVLSAVAFRIPATAWLSDYVWVGWPASLSNIFLIQNITQSRSVICVLWSLPFEIQMYIFLPAIYLLINRFPSIKTTFLLWLAGIVVAGAEYLARGSSCAPEFLLTRYFPCFLMGVVAWRLMSMKNGRLPGWSWILLLAVLVGAYRAADAFRIYGPVLVDATHGTLRNDHGVWWPPSLDLVNDWVFCCITGVAIPRFTDITNRLLIAISKRIAQYSYGIYICHVPLMWLCFKKLHVGSVTAEAVLSAVLTAVVSILLYHCLENPAIRFGKKFAIRFSMCCNRLIISGSLDEGANR